jgi:aminoglycoside phosphotransferase (APT) family kinase protein
MPLDAGWGVEERIVEHGDLVDVDRAIAVWRAALDAGPWPGPGVWIHGDLLGGNLLVRDDRLSAVIDWGPLTVGDPAADVAAAWTMFEGSARDLFRERLAVDDATWARARAWVMLPALTGVRYYETSVPAFAERSRRHLEAVTGDPTLG